MAAVTPTSSKDITGETARRKAEAAPRAPSDDATQKPTPTQEENDLAAAGVVPHLHEYDGSPLQFPHGAPDNPELPPGVGGGGDAAPAITSLSPASAVAGDAADITMVVNGSGFTPDSVIVMNGYDEPTTFGSAGQVSTGVKPSLFVVPAEVPVFVRNGSFVSNQLMFSFTAAKSKK